MILFPIQYGHLVSYRIPVPYPECTYLGKVLGWVMGLRLGERHWQCLVVDVLFPIIPISCYYNARKCYQQALQGSSGRRACYYSMSFQINSPCVNMGKFFHCSIKHSFTAAISRVSLIQNILTSKSTVFHRRRIPLAVCTGQ